MVEDVGRLGSSKNTRGGTGLEVDSVLQSLNDFLKDMKKYHLLSDSVLFC